VPLLVTTPVVSYGRIRRSRRKGGRAASEYSIAAIDPTVPCAGMSMT
jgi:hypothetical protein